MKHSSFVTTLLSVLLLCGCTVFDTKLTAGIHPLELSSYSAQWQVLRPTKIVVSDRKDEVAGPDCEAYFDVQEALQKKSNALWARGDLSPDQKMKEWKKLVEQNTGSLQLQAKCQPRWVEFLQHNFGIDHFPVFMRQALCRVRGVTVIDNDTTDNSLSPDWIVKGYLHEVIPDIEAANKDANTGFFTLGYGAQVAMPYVSITTASFLGPIGSLLMGFDIITGIPTDWGENTKRGAVTIDVSLVDARTGRVAASFPVQGIFPYGDRHIGREPGPYLKIGRHSSPVDAIRDIADLAAEQLAKALNEKSR